MPLRVPHDADDDDVDDDADDDDGCDADRGVFLCAPWFPPGCVLHDRIITHPASADAIPHTCSATAEATTNNLSTLRHRGYSSE